MDIAEHAEPLHRRDAVDQRVLEIVSALVMELRGAGRRPPVALRDSLERDLGISSLERVELLLRLEREFGVRLPDATMAEAGTPADLAAALLSAAPAGPAVVPRVQPAVGAATAAPAHVRTLVEALRWHTEAAPDRVHIFLREDEGEERSITYRELWDGHSGLWISWGGWPSPGTRSA